MGWDIRVSNSRVARGTSGGGGEKRACEILTETWFVSSTEAETVDIHPGASTLRAIPAPSDHPLHPRSKRVPLHRLAT